MLGQSIYRRLSLYTDNKDPKQWWGDNAAIHFLTMAHMYICTCVCIYIYVNVHIRQFKKTSVKWVGWSQFLKIQYFMMMIYALSHLLSHLQLPCLWFEDHEASWPLGSNLLIFRRWEDTYLPSIGCCYVLGQCIPSMYIDISSDNDK